MAEAPSLYAESLEKLDQELTCPICLKHFEEPKVLPCCHYYCRECIVQMQARTRGKDYFQCPECRKETRLPGNDPDSLLTAFFVNRMKELFSMMQKAQGKVELTCESCRRGTTPVKSFCRHCALFICQSCEEAHRTMRSFSDHVVVPLDDLRQNTAAHFPVKKEAQIKCKEHGGKMKLYCHDCQQLICRDCIVKDHKEHEYDFVNKAAVQCRASLKESVAPLRKIQASLSQAMIETEKATSAVSQSGADIAAAIDRKFDELIASAQKRREELHCEAREKLEANQKSLTAQRKNIQQATAEVQSMIEFVDHKSHRANDQELLGLQKQIHDRVNEVAEKYSNPIGQFISTEVCHLELRCTSQLAVEDITLCRKGDLKSEGNPKPEPNMSPQALTSNDLPILNTHLRGVSKKWYSLGFYLGFTTDQLENLVSTVDVNCDHAVYLSKVLSAWLQSANPPTLEAICRALSHERMGEQELALQLLQKRKKLAANFNNEATPVIFTPNDLSVLSKHLHNVSPKWYTLGIQLGVPKEMLVKLIPVNYDPAVRLNQVLSTWLHHANPPTLDALCRALYHKSVGAERLAEWLLRQSDNLKKETSATPTGKAISNLALPPDQSGEGSSSFTSPYPNGQPPSSSHPSGHGQLSTETLEAGVTSMPNTMPVTHTQPSYVAAGTDPLFSFGTVDQPAFKRRSKGPISHGHHHNKGSAAGDMDEDKNCPICLDEFTNPKRTKCGHKFCSGCLKEALKHDPFCPTCKQPLRSIIGKQPVGGQMTYSVHYFSLPGYQGCNTIQINYSIPGGVQGPEHPNPGQRFSGTSRTAYLPDTHEGREVLKLLRKAFDARLIFTVGTSGTTGAQNTVVWNDIHHKTSTHGGAYGYPDHTYLQRVKEDLAAKGIVSTSSIHHWDTHI